MFFISPIPDQGYWLASSLSARFFHIRAHLIAVLAIVKLFNPNLLLWPWRPSIFVSLIETFSRVSMPNCSLPCISIVEVCHLH